MRVRKARKPSPEHPRKRDNEKSPKRHENLGLRKPSGPLMKSPKTQAIELEQQRIALQLLAMGYSYPQIGERLGVDYKTAQKRVQDGFAHASDDLEEYAKETRRKLDLKFDMMDRAWSVEAAGGKIADPSTGEERIVKKSAKAAQVFLRTQRERIALLRAVSPQKMEMSGPVVVSAKGEPDEDEADRLWRAQFGDSVLPKGKKVEESEKGEPDDGGPVH